MTGFNRFLWNASTDLKIVSLKKTLTQIRHRWDGSWHSVRWHHHTNKKRLCFFICPSEGANLGYFPTISWHNLGCKILGLFTFLDVFFIFWNFDSKRENLKKKWKKTCFGSAKKGKHGYFCRSPTGFPGDFSGFYYFFLIGDMSVMCLFLLTNYVGLKDKELQMF